MHVRHIKDVIGRALETAQEELHTETLKKASGARVTKLKEEIEYYEGLARAEYPRIDYQSQLEDTILRHSAT
jgi:hypothetical protein